MTEEGQVFVGVDVPRSTYRTLRVLMEFWGLTAQGVIAGLIDQTKSTVESEAYEYGYDDQLAKWEACAAEVDLRLELEGAYAAVAVGQLLQSELVDD